MTLGVTGHRPDKLGGYSTMAQARLEEFAMHKLEQLRPSKVVTGMALGWDLAIAWACATLYIPFVAAVPFEGQEKAWPVDSQRHYWNLCKRAQTVQILSAGEFSREKMQARNEWIVNQSDSMLALWNGTSGGTCNCLRYAARVDRPVLNAWDEWYAFAHERGAYP